MNINKIIISRTDNIGDVMLTLPMAGLLKKRFPDTQIAFLGKGYTQSLIERSQFVDEFINWDLVEKDEQKLENFGADAIIHVFPTSAIAKKAKQAGISLRIGTSHRVFNWLTCNELVNFSRKKSDLHESQLNIKLLKPIGITVIPSLEELAGCYGWEFLPTSEAIQSELTQKFNLILHMKSKGSAKEWGLTNFFRLAKSLPEASFQIFVSGTASEGAIIRNECPDFFDLPHVTDICGKFSLSEFTEFIHAADGLLACSTGPLHIAAATGIHTLGLYPSLHPMHAGRWQPIGKKAEIISEKQTRPEATILEEISVEMVQKRISDWL